MHGDVTRSASGRPDPRTPAAVIVAFRSDHRLSVERLASFLGLETEVLREYEALGSAPPWVAYALLGVAYERFGVEPVDVSSEAPAQPPLLLPRAAAGADAAGAERAA